jgi:RNA polymerase sigma factor (sigma-70 family)
MQNGADISLTDWQSEIEPAAATQLSLEQAFAAHHRLVYRYALGLTREPGLAEDVAQEVFVRLYQNLVAAQRDDLLKAWLLRVTANVARNVLRSRSRSQTRDESFVARQDHESASPESDLLRKAEIDSARLALAKLKEPLRSCLLLRNEGLSYKEIAAALELNEASIGALLVRARREFIRSFSKVGGKVGKT